MSASLKLTKWYLDLVTEGGDVRIAYVADLELGPLRVGYESLLGASASGARQSKTYYGSVSLPVSAGESLAWGSRKLGMSGRWHPRSAPIRREVLRTSEGSVEWHCIAPRAGVELREGEGSLTGLGYAECLTLTIPPWRLPIDALYWGRFVAEDVELVWVDWRGPHAFRSVVANGEELGHARVTAEGVFDDARGLALTFSESLLLRAGTLATTALALLPERVRRALPGRALLIDERKWRARGLLSRKGQPPVSGWVIHEVVTWP